MDMTHQLTPTREEFAPEDLADIWVALPDSSAEALLGEARRLADALGCYVHAVTSGEAAMEQAIALGADRVHPVPVPAFVDFIASQPAEFVFFPVSQASQAALLAQRRRAGLIADARNLSIDDATRALLGSYPVYGGEYFQDVAVTSVVKMATLDPRHCPPPYPDPSRSGEVAPVEAPAIRQRVRDLGPVDYAPQPWRPLTRARIIVSVGRGLKDVEGIQLAKELAKKLGAELAGDQSALDAGWVDEAHLVGVTGQEVAPELYIAVGIRGDTVHNAAMVQARQVVAVHSNPTASLLSLADQAVVTEPKAFVQRLLAELA